MSGGADRAADEQRRQQQRHPQRSAWRVNQYHMSRLAFALRSAAVTAGCYGDTGIKLTVTPDHASLFGQTDVTITGDFASLGDIDYFSVAGVQVINPRWSGSSVTVTRARRAQARHATTSSSAASAASPSSTACFTYDPPSAGVPLTWMAFGASFTQGTESNGIDPHTQTLRRLGADRQRRRRLPRPAAVHAAGDAAAAADGLLPRLHADPRHRRRRHHADAVATSPDTGLFDLRYARLDWTLKNRNVAVGGAKVSDILNGVHGAIALLAHIVNDPDIDYCDAVAPETTSQIDRVEALDPDIGFTTDLLGNDIDAAVVQPDDLDPTMITPVDAGRAAACRR